MALHCDCHAPAYCLRIFYIVIAIAVGCRYEEDADRRERFYYTMLGGGGTPPASACPDVARLVVQQHFNCPSAWCILPLQVRHAIIPSCHTCSRSSTEQRQHGDRPVLAINRWVTAVHWAARCDVPYCLSSWDPPQGPLVGSVVAKQQLQLLPPISAQAVDAFLWGAGCCA